MSDRSSTRKAEIRTWVIDGIKNGELTPRSRIPSEHQLMKLFSVSRMTVHSALSELAKDGVLRRVKGLGTFVASPGTHLTIVGVTDPSEEIRGRGARYGLDLITLVERYATPAERLIFHMRGSGRLFHLVAVHRADGIAVALEDRLVNPVIAPDFMQTDFLSTSTFTHLTACAPFPEGSHVIRAVQATDMDRSLLNLTAGEPCLEIERTTWTEASVVTHVKIRYPGAAHALFGTISRS